MMMDEWETLEVLGERVVQNTKSIKQNDRQRRDRVVDIYGAEFYRVGDSGSPARFYISISPDMIYLERFQFKIITQPFVSTAGSGTSAATVTVNDTRLNVGDRTLSNGSPVSPNPHDHSISPNPHTHTTQSHTHNINAGVVLIPTTADDFKLSIEGIDITEYLMAQGTWINGEGIFPSAEIEHDFDILEVASDMAGEGKKREADLLLRPGYKPIELSSSAPFSATMSLYLKYSHVNR